MPYTTNDIDDYMDKLTPEQAQELLSHCNEFDIKPEICAWYSDIDDFHDDHAEIGYTKEQSTKLFNDNADIFKKFSDGQIVKLVK